MPELEQELRYNPYFAGIFGKSADEANSLELRIDALPASVREFLMTEDVDDQLRTAMQDAGVPDAYSVALAKIIFLIALGDVSIDSVEPLLLKIGLDQAQSHAMTTALASIIAPVIAAKAAAAAPKILAPVPPLTVQRSSIGGDRVPPANVIDLRPKS